jgi:predicted HTH transcriptional regulator
MTAIKKVSSIKGLTGLNMEELSGYEFVKSMKEVTKKQYAEHFNFDEKKAYRQLSKMRKLELLGDNGESPKSNFYKYVFKS